MPSPELYSTVLARQIVTNLYPLIINVGADILARLIRAAINILTRKNTVDTANFQLDKSIFRDLLILKSDGEDQWNHVFTNKHGHVKLSTDEERGVLALVLKMFLV
jgi:hypothetical protein